MTLNDMRILERAYEDALRELSCSATAIADLVSDGQPVPEELLRRYWAAKLGVESTRRDVEYCLSLEISEIMGDVSEK
jgi:hypothetical protein